MSRCPGRTSVRGNTDPERPADRAVGSPFQTFVGTDARKTTNGVAGLNGRQHRCRVDHQLLVFTNHTHEFVFVNRLVDKIVNL